MNTRKKTWLGTALVGMLVIAGLVSGCGEEGATAPDELTIASLAGSWTGTEFAISSSADSAIALDLIASGGAILVSVEPIGSFTGTAVIPGVLIGDPALGTLTVPLAGVMRLIDETTLRIDFVPEIPPIFTTMDPTFTLSGNTLTILDESAEFDFDADGATEPSVYQIRFGKN